MLVDILGIVFIFALVIVIIALIFDRYTYFEQSRVREEKLLEENSRLVKALISKNAQDYVMTTSIDKVAPEEKPALPPDMVPEESLSDEEFFKSIGKQLENE